VEYFAKKFNFAKRFLKIQLNMQQKKQQILQVIMVQVQTNE
jgi:hypothetical protein